MSKTINGRGARCVVVSVPELVDRALLRAAADLAAARALPHRTHLDNLRRCERMAAIEDRRRRWWAVLERWAYGSGSPVPIVFGTAIIEAEYSAADACRYWSELADYYRTRAAGLDPDDTASGWAS
jgi:hypothetical protein